MLAFAAVAVPIVHFPAGAQTAPNVRGGALPLSGDANVAAPAVAPPYVFGLPAQPPAANDACRNLTPQERAGFSALCSPAADTGYPAAAPIGGVGIK